MKVRIPLSLLPTELRQVTTLPVPSYRVTYAAALDGRIPAERGANGRWTVAREDLPKIVAVLCRAPSTIAA